MSDIRYYECPQLMQMTARLQSQEMASAEKIDWLSCLPLGEEQYLGDMIKARCLA